MCHVANKSCPTQVSHTNLDIHRAHTNQARDRTRTHIRISTYLTLTLDRYVYFPIRVRFVDIEIRCVRSVNIDIRVTWLIYVWHGLFGHRVSDPDFEILRRRISVSGVDDSNCLRNRFMEIRVGYRLRDLKKAWRNHFIQPAQRWHPLSRSCLWL